MLTISWIFLLLFQIWAHLLIRNTDFSDKVHCTINECNHSYNQVTFQLLKIKIVENLYHDNNSFRNN